MFIEVIKNDNIEIIGFILRCHADDFSKIMKIRSNLKNQIEKKNRILDSTARFCEEFFKTCAKAFLLHRTVPNRSALERKILKLSNDVANHIFWGRLVFFCVSD